MSDGSVMKRVFDRLRAGSAAACLASVSIAAGLGLSGCSGAPAPGSAPRQPTLTPAVTGAVSASQGGWGPITIARTGGFVPVDERLTIAADGMVSGTVGLGASRRTVRCQVVPAAMNRIWQEFTTAAPSASGPVMDGFDYVLTSGTRTVTLTAIVPDRNALIEGIDALFADAAGTGAGGTCRTT